MANRLERMRRAGENLGKIRKIVEEGRPEKQVTFPLSEAALTLRIPKRVLAGLEERGQVLGVAVENEMATIKLFGNISQQREAYSFLYGLIQGLRDGRADLFLKTQKAPLLLTAENPDLGETIGILKEGKYDFPDEELTALHLQLWGRWQSLTDKTNLFPPEKVFS
ncbi:MAG: hypothetical protein ACOX5S_00265 [Patescibacteria group bacterium]|jgi:hypothetical protein